MFELTRHAGYTLLGCFQDTDDSDGASIGQYGRDFANELETSSSMTVRRCKGLCDAAGYTYFALQNGDTCFCDNSYGDYGAASNPCETFPRARACARGFCRRTRARRGGAALAR